MKQQSIITAHQILKAQRRVSKAYLMERLECSESSFKRTLAALRSDFNAPLEYDRAYNCYQYTDERYELDLPGFWASPETLLALVSMQKLLEQMRLDILDKHFSSLKDDIQRHLKRKNIQTDQVNRIRILPITARITNHYIFQSVASALLQRKKLHITYHARGTDTITSRIISPQRLAYYRENWQLDAWCHSRNAIRMFSLDRIQQSETLAEVCHEIEDEALNQFLASAYGIFSGSATQTVTLLFSSERARWVSDEEWHPKQKSRWLADGRYQLEFPYGNDSELLMDIMRHLPQVEVVSPLALKQKLVQQLEKGIEMHKK